MPIPQIMRTKEIEYSPNYAVNGKFSSDTGWTKGDGWSIAGGVASCDGSQGDVTYLTNDNLVVSGTRYRTKFTVSNFSDGTVRTKLGSVNGATHYANGTYTDVIEASGTSIALRANATFVGSVDNLTVEKIS